MTNAEIRELADNHEVKALNMVLLLILLGFFTVIPFVSQILYFGDWDFWVDWKDKLWWPIIAPAASVMLWGAIQYIAWRYLRLPLGATFSAVACVVVAWSSRIGSFHMLEAYPLNFVWPSTTIPIALMLDLVLFTTRSFFFTSVVGGFLCGLLFYATNWLMLMPFLQPVTIQGSTFTVADLLGYQFLRPQTPEYLRRIDQGTLTAFLGERIWITVFTAGVIAPVAYWLGMGIGWLFGTLPIGKNLKKL